MTWDGRYENTKEGKRSLEEDILDAPNKVRYPTSDGGTVQERDGRIDVYSPSDSPKGHSHDWYDITTNETGHHD